jgi:hypothetical protein
MKERFAKLINVKNMMSLALTAVFCVLALRGDIVPENYEKIFTMVISFFFGYQLNKKEV